MNYNDLDSLRLLTRERHERRLREADAEGLARAMRVSASRRRRLPMAVGLALAAGLRQRPRRLGT